MNKTQIEIKAKLDALRAELESAEKRRQEIQAEDTALRKRIESLRGAWRSSGEIKLAETELRDAAFPIASSHKSWGDSMIHTRIINVGPRWIELRVDGGDRIAKYDKNTGQKMNTKYNYDKINPKPLLEIWEKHHQLNGETPEVQLEEATR